MQPVHFGLRSCHFIITLPLIHCLVTCFEFLIALLPSIHCTPPCLACPCLDHVSAFHAPAFHATPALHAPILLSCHPCLVISLQSVSGQPNEQGRYNMTFIVKGSDASLPGMLEHIAAVEGVHSYSVSNQVPSVSSVEDEQALSRDSSPLLRSPAAERSSSNNGCSSSGGGGGDARLLGMMVLMMHSLPPQMQDLLVSSSDVRQLL
jgi:hypothetical protein